MNKKIPSDYTRFIRLEGVGEVSRPVDINQSVTGFSQLVSLRIYKFLQGQVINGEAEEDEVCIVFLSGDVTMEVTGKENRTWTFQGRKNVFDGLPYLMYLPPHYHYKLSPHTDAEVAYARAKAEGRFPPRLIEPKNLEQKSVEQGGRVVHILQEGEAEKLICAEYYLPRGQEQTYNQPASEQLVYHRLKPSDSNLFARRSGDSEIISPVHGDCLAIGPNEHITISTRDCDVYNLYLAVRLQ